MSSCVSSYWIHGQVSFACVESMFNQLIRGYPLDRIFTVVLMLRIWVLYGKSKKIGLFLGTVYVLGLVASLIVFTKQPTVSQITLLAIYMYINATLDRPWFDTTLYVLSSLLTSFFAHEWQYRHRWRFVYDHPQPVRCPVFPIYRSSSHSNSSISVLLAHNHRFLNWIYYIEPILREGLPCTKGFDSHARSQCSFHPVSCHRDCIQWMSLTILTGERHIT